jgi:hypothetical protein
MVAPLFFAGRASFGKPMGNLHFAFCNRWRLEIANCEVQIAD